MLVPLALIQVRLFREDHRQTVTEIETGTEIAIGTENESGTRGIEIGREIGGWRPGRTGAMAGGMDGGGEVDRL